MKDESGRRSEKYPAPCRKSKQATGLEGRQPPRESPMLPVVLSCFLERACQNPGPLDSPKLSQSPGGPPSLWRLASAGLPRKLSQRPPRWGAGRALAAPPGLLLTSSLAEVPDLASCELASSREMMRGWLGKVPFPLFLCIFGKERQLVALRGGFVLAPGKGVRMVCGLRPLSQTEMQWLWEEGAPFPTQVPSSTLPSHTFSTL